MFRSSSQNLSNITQKHFLKYWCHPKTFTLNCRLHTTTDHIHSQQIIILLFLIVIYSVEWFPTLSIFYVFIMITFNTPFEFIIFTIRCHPPILVNFHNYHVKNITNNKNDYLFNENFETQQSYAFNAQEWYS